MTLSIDRNGSTQLRALTAMNTEPTPGAGVDDDPNDRPVEGFWQNAGRAWTHSQMVVEDGVRETIGERPATTVAVAGGGTALVGMGLALNKSNALNVPFNRSAFVRSSLQEATVNNPLRITPTLAAAVVGPAVADGVSYLAPNLVPKYRKGMPDGEKSSVQVKRAIAGGLAVGALAGITWLVKPSFFQRAGFISDKAIHGFQEIGEVATRTGRNGVPVQEVVRSGTIPFGAVVPSGMSVLKSSTPMVADAVFSHRVMLGIAGGGATAYLGNKALTSEGNDRAMLGIGAAVAGAATVGGMVAVPHLTRTASATSGLLPNKALFWKPSQQFLKELATKVIAPTAATGATAAFNYFDIVNDFEKIVDQRSPFRK